MIFYYQERFDRKWCDICKSAKFCILGKAGHFPVEYVRLRTDSDPQMPHNSNLEGINHGSAVDIGRDTGTLGGDQGNQGAIQGAQTGAERPGSNDRATGKTVANEKIRLTERAMTAKIASAGE